MAGSSAGTVVHVSRPRDLVMPLLLLLLLERPGHGYELAGRLASAGYSSWAGPGPVYRHLERMEEAGLVTCTMDVSAETGPRRCIYRLTALGADTLGQAMHELSKLGDFLPEVLGRFAHASDRHKGGG